MGTYSTEEWRELFGGDPEPGEAYLPLHAADHLRKSERENGHHCHRDLSTPSAGECAVSHSSNSGSASPAEDPSVDYGCPNCEAPAGQPCQHWCHWEAVS